MCRKRAAIAMKQGARSEYVIDVGPLDDVHSCSTAGQPSVTISTILEFCLSVGSDLTREVQILAAVGRGSATCQSTQKLRAAVHCWFHFGLG